MATIRGWLDCEGFDWENGRILGICLCVVARGENTVTAIDKKAPVLDEEFSAWGAAPARIMAEDDKRLYFVTTYDGIQDMYSIYKDLDQYIQEGWLPLPGR